jgi:hypothetical protein
MFGKKFHGYDWIEIAPNNYTFNTPGNKYIVDFENQGNDDYNVVFKTVDKLEDSTNEGVQFKVMATILEIVQHFIVAYPYKALTFKPRDGRRHKLYKLFIDNNFSANDYYFYFRPDIIKMVKK